MKTTLATVQGFSRRIRWALLFIAAFWTVSPISAQNCSLACNGMTQISLDANCDTEVLYDMILNAQMTTCRNGRYQVRVLKYKNGPAVFSSPYVNKAHIGQTLTVEVMDQVSRNKCWGQIIVEDKMPPRIECSNDTLYCFEMRNYAGPVAWDNCQKAAFVRPSEEYPFNGGPLYNDYTSTMNAVFGQGNWDDLMFSDIAPEVLFSKAYCYIWLEGSGSDNDDYFAFRNFLNTNRSLIESWVAEGGRLYINTAPISLAYIIDLGFGGVTSFGASGGFNAYATDIDHPVVQGPFQPVVHMAMNKAVAEVYGSTAEGAISFPPGQGVNVILKDQQDFPLLVEMAYGVGHVLFGTLTPSGAHTPQPNARNLKWNILAYLKNVGKPDVELTLLGEVPTMLTCDPLFVQKITRTYIATDRMGNQSQPCTYDIYLKRFPHRLAVGPDDRSVATDNPIMCQANIDLDANGHPHPSVTGVPTIQGIPLWPNQNFYCNIAVTYRDELLSVRGCVQRYMRQWTINEWWCSRNIPTNFTQVIEIVDDQGPVVTPPRDMTVTTSGRTCEAIVQIPPALVYDSCSFNNVTVEVTYPGGVIQNNGGPARLPVGEHVIEYTAYDECWNPGTGYMMIKVEDKTAPVAVCDQHTVVGLTYDGYADVYANSFDDGSYDDCWIDSIAVRRMDGGGTCDPGNDRFGPFVTFCCEDLRPEPIIVVMRVWDESGNHNDCMIEVELQDKMAPVLTCPPNVTISCDYHLDREDLSDFGTVVKDPAPQKALSIKAPYLLASAGPLLDGLAHDNCEFEIQLDTSFQITNCNVGTITRTFTAFDFNGSQTCTQTITIQNISPLNINRADPDDPNDDVIWPEDYTTDESCDVGGLHPDSLPTIYGWPLLIGEDRCDLAAPTFKDQTFPIAGDNACFKIIRTWKIIDWCQPTRTGYEEWVYEQIIKVRNLVPPTILSGCDPVAAETLDPNCREGYIELIAEGTDDCTPVDELQWSYEIDEGSTGTWGPKRTGTGPEIDASDFYPIGDHRIRYSFEDRCGNKTTCTTTFSIINRKTPTVFCKNGIIVNLQPIIDINGDTVGGEVEVWASDLDDGSFHTCGYDLTFSFDPDGMELGRTYNCDSLESGNTFLVTIYVTDEEGNQSSCVDSIIVQDNEHYCTNMVTRAVIGGRISTEEQARVSNVSVRLQGAGATSYLTAADGLYAFPPMPFGGSYSVQPVKNDDHLNGISTADIIEIQRYLLGSGQLDSPYKLIAADVNGSRDISVKDIIELRKLILGLQQEFTGSPSWRFIDRNYQFADPADPFTDGWPETYDIRGLQTNMMSIDFTAVKVGDVNGTVRANAGQPLAGRTNEHFLLQADDLRYRAGDLIEVPVYATAGSILDGFQFTLQFDAHQLEWVAGRAGDADLGEQHIGKAFLQQGMVTVSWNGPEAIQVEDAPVFTLVFRALHDGQLRDQLLISSDITVAEVYLSGRTIQDIRLEFRQSKGKGVFALYQNTPNPFGDETVIRFALGEDEVAVFRVFDVNGRELLSRTLEGRKGINELVLNGRDLAASGVLYYQLETRTHAATRKMVLLK